MTRIKLIATDLDGTLLDDQKRIPEENLAALKEAYENGILVALASGRMLSNVERTEALLGLDCILIAYNGGKVAGPRSSGRPLLIHRPLPADVAQVFVEFSHETGLLLNFYDDEILFAEDGGDRRRFMELYTRRTGVPYQIVGDLRREFAGVSPTKLIVLADPPEAARVVETLRARVGDRACISRSEPEYVEITAPGVDKGAILGPVASQFGVSIEEVMALGDADNDITMLRAAGLGVALANAPERVRAEADRVTDRTNNEAGAAEAIRRWALHST